MDFEIPDFAHLSFFLVKELQIYVRKIPGNPALLYRVQPQIEPNSKKRPKLAAEVYQAPKKNQLSYMRI
jgi:hypothetical protein